MAEQVIEIGKPFTVKIPKPKKRNILNPLNAWRIFSQKGLNTGISSSPQREGLSILGSQSTDPEQLQKDFGCCCLTKGDCILSISVIDEDTTIGYRNPDVRDRDYEEFRANYPERNLVVFRPQAPPARYCSVRDGRRLGDCSIYTAQEWRDILADPANEDVFIFGPLVLPEGWGDSGVDYIETVLREDTGQNTADDWFELLLNMGVIDPDGTNSDPNKLVITKTFGKIAIFLDDSGSMMVRSTVPKSWQLFQDRLRDEMDITIENGRLIERPGSNEIWIGPHILIEGEDCLATDFPFEVSSATLEAAYSFGRSPPFDIPTTPEGQALYEAWCAEDPDNCTRFTDYRTYTAENIRVISKSSKVIVRPWVVVELDFGRAGSLYLRIQADEEISQYSFSYYDPSQKVGTQRPSVISYYGGPTFPSPFQSEQSIFLPAARPRSQVYNFGTVTIGSFFDIYGPDSLPYGTKLTLTVRKKESA